MPVRVPASTSAAAKYRASWVRSGMTKGAYRNRRAGANVERPARRGGGRSLAPLSVLFLAQKMLTELSHREDTTAGLNPDALDPLRDPFHCQDRSAGSHNSGVDYLPARPLSPTIWKTIWTNAYHAFGPAVRVYDQLISAQPDSCGCEFDEARKLAACFS